MTTSVLHDPIYKRHDTGEGHPESPARCDAAARELLAAPLAGRLGRLSPRAATDEELLLCHTPAYLQIVQRDAAAGRRGLSTGDTAIGPESPAVACKAVGGVLGAVDAVMTGKAKNAFCIVRPPGHHASAGRGMGFCVFNNVALAARYARKEHRVERALIVDWDVHHGNGTQDIFYEDPSVLFFSTHQWPLYPGTGLPGETGRGEGEGTTLNCPFGAGAGGEQIRRAFTDELLPAAERFDPDLVLISAGFDSRIGDPFGGLLLTDADFAELTHLLLDLADRHAGGRVVSVLEGGYSLPGLAAAAEAHVRALCAI